MTDPIPSIFIHRDFRKSSYSTGEDPQCVEIARPGPIVAIRDSKNPTGGRLTIRPATFETFLTFTRPDTTG